MALPATRNTTNTIGAPAKSADLNALQDCVVGALHGELEDIVSAIEGIDIGASGTFNDNPLYWDAGAAPDLLTIPLPLKPGDTLKTIYYSHYSGAAGNKEFHVYKQVAATGAYTLIHASWSTVHDPTTGSVQVHTQDGDDYQVAAGEKLFIRYITTHANDRFYLARVRYWRPSWTP